MPDLEVSALHVKGFANLIDLDAQKEAIFSSLSPETKEALQNPNSKRWHQGMVVEEIVTALFRVGGAAKVEDMNYLLASRSFGPILNPLLKVVVAISGASPSTLFKFLPQAVSVKVVVASVHFRSNQLTPFPFTLLRGWPSLTAAAGSQFLVVPLHRLGFLCLAFSYTLFLWASNSMSRPQCLSFGVTN